MLNLAELLWGRFNSGTSVQPGTYLTLRALAYVQLTEAGSLPAGGTWHRISSDTTLTAADLATTVNSVLHTAYTAASFHAYNAASDAVPEPGQQANDA